MLYEVITVRHDHLQQLPRLLGDIDARDRQLADLGRRHLAPLGQLAHFGREGDEVEVRLVADGVV